MTTRKKRPQPAPKGRSTPVRRGRTTAKPVPATPVRRRGKDAGSSEGKSETPPAAKEEDALPLDVLGDLDEESGLPGVVTESADEVLAEAAEEADSSESARGVDETKVTTNDAGDDESLDDDHEADLDAETDVSAEAEGESAVSPRGDDDSIDTRTEGRDESSADAGEQEGEAAPKSGPFLTDEGDLTAGVDDLEAALSGSESAESELIEGGGTGRW
ncbi:MAG: hypothetical protein QM784_17935 [Polyangiaceae bacterium]